MVKPSQFILTTDFATLKNDATGSTSFTIPGSLVIAPGTGYTASYNLTIGTIGAVARTYINSSASPTQYFFGSGLQIVANGVDSSLGATQYTYYITITRSSATTLTINVLIPSLTGSPGTLTTEATVRTITILANTFIAPFAS